MALTKQQQNKRAQKQSKKAKTRQHSTDQYQRMVNDRKRSESESQNFDKSAMKVVNQIDALRLTPGETALGIIVRGEGYSGASTCLAKWSEDSITGKLSPADAANYYALTYDLIDEGSLSVRSKDNTDVDNTDKFNLPDDITNEKSSGVRLLKAVSLLANISHNYAGRLASSLPTEISSMMSAATSAVNKLVREVDPRACKIIATLTSQPVSPGIARNMGILAAKNELVSMDVHDQIDSILIMDNDNNAIAAISLYFCIYNGAPLLAKNEDTPEVPAGTTFH